ncbi:GNAT family N-acetyltransferase [Bacillus canaveralius]|uniref:GNAT family N-acetyltransferase n=1 Tax=Bacillus canaveralius TaxID=1403243 RepID=UPI000F796D84|nr:GNAT family N-acetyltransferase [Bacillus canaveralius]RSK53485.1 GNAT family N-acetyltransferase [Bacillus canaveralius]
MSCFKIIDQATLWNVLLKTFINIDCYYSYEYGKLFANKENGELFAAYFEDNTTKIFYPFIKRKVAYEEETYDIVTPYGYGGPLVEGSDISILEFYQLFSEYCSLNNIIAETIRFHPLYKNNKIFEKVMDIEYIRQTTSVDLTVSLEEIRQNYSSMNKRNIKKAKMNNVSCFIGENNLDNIHKFIQMYKETMDRNKAASYYYFDENYFIEQVKDTSISKTYLLFAQFNHEIIAGIMVIVGKEYSHYHLGASKTNHLELKPNNLLFDFMIEFCISKGSKDLHLGGGYQENDGLFKFKTSFTNNNNHDYYIGKKIHNLNQYNDIIDNLKKLYEINENYFPAYRGQMKRKILHI